MIVGCENLGFGPTDLETGEAAIFSKFDQLIFLDKEGSITSTAAGSSIQQFKDGNIVLISKGGATLGMSESAAVSEHDELFKSTHFGGRGGTPTAVIGTALGAAGAVRVSGTDTAFTVEMDTDPMTTTTGTMATITTAKAFGATPHGVISPSGDKATIPLMNGAVYLDVKTASTLTIETTATPTTHATYRYTIHLIQ